MKKHILKKFLNKKGQSMDAFLLLTIVLIVLVVFAASPIVVDLMDKIFEENNKVYQENNIGKINEQEKVIVVDNTIVINGELDENESITIKANIPSIYNIVFLRENKKIECNNCYIEMQGNYYYVKTSEQEYWVKPNEIIKLEKVE